jgi:lambda repressor-like predicted transcriptional regulator
MTPEQIKSELALKGRKIVTMTSISKELGCSQAAVTLVINKKAISNRIMRAVAKAIEKPVEQVFPEYFAKNVSINSLS